MKLSKELLLSAFSSLLYKCIFNYYKATPNKPPDSKYKFFLKT